MSNSLWSLALVVILTGLAVLARRADADTSRAVVWHNAVWIVVLGLFGSNLIAYDQASPAAWLVLLCGLLSFNAGAFLPLIRAKARNLPGKQSPAVPKPVISRRFLLVACLVYFSSFAAYLYGIQIHYGLATLLTDPAAVRRMSADGETYLSLTPLIVRIGLYLGPVLFVIFAVRDAVSVPLRPVVRIVAAGIVAVTMLAMLQRTNFFMAVLWYFAYVLVTYRRPPARGGTAAREGMSQEPARGSRTTKWRRARPVALIVLGVLVLLTVFQLVGGALKKTGEQALSTGRVSSVLAATGMSDVYVYATAGVPAFLKLVDSRNEEWPPAASAGKQIVGDYNPQTYGAASLSGIGKVLPVGREWNPIAPFVDVGVFTNVFTWFELPYRDFRLAGVVAYGLIMGLVTTGLLTLRSRGARYVWIQSAFFSAVFFSTFVSRTGTVIFWIGIVFILVATSRLPAVLEGRILSLRAKRT